MARRPCPDASCVGLGYCGMALRVNGRLERPNGAPDCLKAGMLSSANPSPSDQVRGQAFAERCASQGRSPMKYRCAILDDYQNVALSYADWPSLAFEVDIKVFNQP